MNLLKNLVSVSFHQMRYKTSSAWQSCFCNRLSRDRRQVQLWIDLKSTLLYNNEPRLLWGFKKFGSKVHEWSKTNRKHSPHFRRWLSWLHWLRPSELKYTQCHWYRLVFKQFIYALRSCNTILLYNLNNSKVFDLVPIISRRHKKGGQNRQPLSVRYCI